MSDLWWVDKGSLLPEQLNVLGIDLDKDLLIYGPPGSGKTNLLLLRANHLAIAEPSHEFYIVCYTNLLTNFIRTGAAVYEFPSNRIKTKQTLFESVLSDHGYLPANLRSLPIAERTAAVDAAMASLKSSGKGHHSFPVLFVDEAQDYPADDLDSFRYLAKNISCAADGRQGLYKTADSAMVWLNSYTWNETIRLKHHYRTAPNIVELADKIMDGKLGHVPMLPTHQYKGDITPVEVVAKSTLAAQIAAMVDKVVRQITIYPSELIGLIIPRRQEFDMVVAALEREPRLAGKWTNAIDRDDFDPEKQVWVSTMHSAKGLEFRCVHFMAAETIEGFHAHARRLAFTGVTRAKTSLTIYYDQPLLPFFASALAEKRTEKVTLDRLFGPPR
jgi:superfamily I DNA/RNA helicase